MLIVDIDGCVFNNHHRKHLIPKTNNSPTCWEAFTAACAFDTPITPVINTAKHLSKKHGFQITFVTSRGETSRQETLCQLDAHFQDVHFELHMRPMTDNRHTVDYKRSVFAKMNLLPQSIIIDDHPEIIAMVKKEFSHVNALLVESQDCTVSV